MNDPLNCWRYSGTDKDGYGQVKYEGKMRKVHRMSAVMFLELDMLNKSLESCHLCHNRNCWNPEHLYIATHRDNMRDAIQLPKTHCKHGHEFTPESTYIDSRGDRSCNICRKERSRQHYAERK